ncbi:hypothetical protein [Spirosoma sp. 209]|uniref:hypothetical protein n=1 Tax=Spirosoma sp. 209 TaxID=1955701 RepID=UPI00098D7202|nr:hypothetical protein [Spirosoma sp. 209]
MEAKAFKLQEYYLITQINDSPQARPSDDYNPVTWKPDPQGGHVNLEFSSYDNCLDYIRNCETPGVSFQIHKLYRRVETTNPALVMLAKGKIANPE